MKRHLIEISNIITCGFCMSFCVVLLWYFLIEINLQNFFINAPKEIGILGDIDDFFLEKFVFSIVYFWIFFMMFCFILSKNIENFKKFSMFFYHIFVYIFFMPFVIAFFLFLIISLNLNIQINIEYLISTILTQIYLIFAIKNIFKNLNKEHKK